MTEIEREIRILSGLHVEERKDAQSPVLAGYAAVFNVETDIGGWFRERIAPGAFADAITMASADIHALFNHNPDVVLGRSRAGTLRLAEDEKGLTIEIDPPDTQDVRDLITKMKRGDIDQMSFAFSMRGGVQVWDEAQDPPLRTIEKVGELYDVSIVTRGAYPTTDVGVRSLQAYRKTQNFKAAARRIALRKEHLDRTVRRTANQV